MALARMTWRFNGAAPPSGDGPVIAVIGGEVRVGAWVTVTGSLGRPCYVQASAPGTDEFDQPFIEVNADNPVPMFQLGPEHLGQRVLVVAKGLTSAGYPSGNDAFSNVIGPVLHAVDPDGTTVATSAEFDTARLAGASVIILAAGTEWTTDFLVGRPLSNVTITTPQDNPAVIRNVRLFPAQLTNVVFEGLHFRYARDWSLANFGTVFQTGSTSNGVTFRGCRWIGDNVTPEEYQAVPPTLLESPYRQPNTPPSNPALPYTVNGTNGMRFVIQGPDLFRSRNVTLDGCLFRNVFRAATVPNSTTMREVRVHGWYFDGILVNGSNRQGTDRLDIRGYYLSLCYGIYDEMDATSNVSGSGNAPHCDALQTAQDFDRLVRPVVDRMLNCIGDTRAYAFGGTITNIINGQQWQGGRIRNALFTGQGSINTYLTGFDVSVDYVTKAAFGGSGGSVMRFGGGSGGAFYSNEARVERTISRENVTRVGFPTSGYYVQADSQVNAAGAITSFIQGPVSVRPQTLADLALHARPRPGSEGMGCLTLTGHMRPFEPLPSPPEITPTSGSGGFTLALDAVAGAQRYEVRYRPTGSTNGIAWTRLTSAGPSFSVSGLAEGGYDVQSFVRTAAGLSGWSDPVVVNVEG